MRESENHHFATTNGIIDSDKSHPLSGRTLGNNIHTVSNYPQTDFFVYKEEKVTL